MITCQACGTQNPPDARYCSNCARKLDPETQQAVVEQRNAYIATGLNVTRVAIVSVVGFVIVLAILFLVLHGV